MNRHLAPFGRESILRNVERKPLASEKRRRYRRRRPFQGRFFQYWLVYVFGGQPFAPCRSPERACPSLLTSVRFPTDLSRRDLVAKLCTGQISIFKKIRDSHRLKEAT